MAVAAKQINKQTCLHINWIDKPEAKSQSKVQPQNRKSQIQMGKFGLWAVTKILCAITSPHEPTTFKHEGGLLKQENIDSKSDLEWPPLLSQHKNIQVDSKRKNMG